MPIYFKYRFIAIYLGLLFIIVIGNTFHTSFFLLLITYQFIANGAVLKCYYPSYAPSYRCITTLHCWRQCYRYGYRGWVCKVLWWCIVPLLAMCAIVKIAKRFA